MNYKIYNDYELIYMVRENDDASSNLLFQKYSPILHSISREFYRKYSSYGYDYDDFFQESVISFYKALSSYDESKNNLFYNFVILCVRRRLSTFCRNLLVQSKNISNESLVEYDLSLIADTSINISDLYRNQEIKNIFINTIFDYPLEISSILELHFNGFSYREIASLLDIPISSVEYRSRKARNTLYTRIRNYCSK